jgi:hypothetical protein
MIEPALYYHLSKFTTKLVSILYSENQTPVLDIPPQ